MPKVVKNFLEFEFEVKPDRTRLQQAKEAAEKFTEEMEQLCDAEISEIRSLLGVSVIGYTVTYYDFSNAKNEFLALAKTRFLFSDYPTDADALADAKAKAELVGDGTCVEKLLDEENILIGYKLV